MARPILLLASFDRVFAREEGEDAIPGSMQPGMGCLM